MTMTTTEDNTTTGLSQSFTQLTEQIAGLRTERKEVADRITAAGVEGDQAIRAGLQQDVTAAREEVERLEAVLAEAKEARAALDARMDAGDSSVEPLEVVQADMAMKITKGKLKPARAALSAAERALAPFLADDHLSMLAAESVGSVVDVPVLIRKRSTDVQGIPDAIVLSQTIPTKGYGTLSASGNVKVTLIGSPAIDWESVEDHLRSTGSEVEVSPQGIVFSEARWPIPRLSQPSEGAVRSYMTDFGRAWDGHVSGAEKVKRMKAEGYLAATGTGWEGLFHVRNIDMNVEDGKVRARVDFIAAARHRAEYMNPRDAVAELHELVGIFRDVTVGGVNGAGEIVSLSLSEDFEAVHNTAWDAKPFDWNNGKAKVPCTVSSSVEIGFRFEPVEV